MSEEFKTYDTFSQTTYLVKLAQDAKTFKRDDGKPDDVSLTFADNSRIKGTETLWVDARVIPFHADRASKLRKGDIVQLVGKVRYKRQDDGSMRGKIYDAYLSSFVNTQERDGAAPEAGRPAFE